MKEEGEKVSPIEAPVVDESEREKKEMEEVPVVANAVPMMPFGCFMECASNPYYWFNQCLMQNNYMRQWSGRMPDQ